MSKNNKEFNKALSEAYNVLLGHLPSEIIQKHMDSINADYQKLHSKKEVSQKQQYVQKQLF